MSEFPDLSNKLAAPAKKSLFERQKAEAEAKRIREEAETAAVYEDFVKSFEDDNRSTFKRADVSGRQQPGGSTVEGTKFSSSAGPPKRHFAPGGGRGLNSGPGSLGPPPNLSKKRAFDGSRVQERGSERGLFAYEDSPERSNDATTAFRPSDDEDEELADAKEEERAAPKPTLQLSSLPPGTSPAVIKSIISSTLNVDTVRILPSTDQSNSSSTERKSISAIVTLAKDTPASDIDAAVNSLQNKYLGWGYYLSLSRHLSSAALGSYSAPGQPLYSSLSSLPFGAKPLPQGNRGPHAPPNLHRGGIAPPSSYNSWDMGRAAPRAHVKVSPPNDIKQLKLIHKTLEAMLTHGPEFEALLMSRPEVQREEKWAWLWDSRSIGGVWYRWRLWQILTGDSLVAGRRAPGSIKRHELFEGELPWTEPEEDLSFEFTTHFNDFISDSDYDSSGEDDSGDELPSRRRQAFDRHDRRSRPEAAQDDAGDDDSYLNPLHKAKLTYLLSRLPKTTAKLRKGDVARVTAFAITHAGKGADEVVDMLVSNILRPLNGSKNANPESKRDEHNEEADVMDSMERRDNEDGSDRREDISGSILIALHLMSDILSASSTSGVRHAWRYRALFETALKSHKVFPWLGRLEKTLGWGRLRAEKWRRSINGVFKLWEGWCVFSSDTHEEFLNDFNHPPLSKEETEVEEAKKMQVSGAKDTTKSRWKSVEVSKEMDNSDNFSAPPLGRVDSMPMAGTDVNMDNESIDDIDGEPMEDIDGEPMDEEELDGDPMEADDDHYDEDVQESADPSVEEAQKQGSRSQEARSLLEVPRRPRAEDMFADSDEE